MFEKKKKKATKKEGLMKKAPAAGAVEVGDDVLEAAAEGYQLCCMYASDPEGDLDTYYYCSREVAQQAAAERRLKLVTFVYGDSEDRKFCDSTRL